MCGTNLYLQDGIPTSLQHCFVVPLQFNFCSHLLCNSLLDQYSIRWLETLNCIEIKKEINPIYLINGFYMGLCAADTWLDSVQQWAPTQITEKCCAVCDCSFSLLDTLGNNLLLSFPLYLMGISIFWKHIKLNISDRLTMTAMWIYLARLTQRFKRVWLHLTLWAFCDSWFYPGGATCLHSVACELLAQRQAKDWVDEQVT